MITFKIPVVSLSVDNQKVTASILSQIPERSWVIGDEIHGYCLPKKEKFRWYICTHKGTIYKSRFVGLVSTARLGENPPTILTEVGHRQFLSIDRRTEFINEIKERTGKAVQFYL